MDKLDTSETDRETIRDKLRAGRMSIAIGQIAERVKHERERQAELEEKARLEANKSKKSKWSKKDKGAKKVEEPRGYEGSRGWPRGNYS